MIYISFIFLFFSQIITTVPESAHYFLDAKKLYNIDKTQQELFKLGFKKIYFTTQDNIKICAFFLDKSQKESIKGTILYCAGFYPGLKEGMCSFYSLVIDQPYNILLFDARGHHESEGDFLSYSGIKNYGTNEHHDIIAALNFINTYNNKHTINKNIIIHGICSGAYFTIKAINYLQQHHDPTLNNIKAIIFDSGWFKFQDVTKTVIYSEFSKRLSKGWFWWAAQPLSFLTYQFYKLFFATHHDAQPNIYESIQTINIPIFFIYCDNDPYVSIKPVQELTQKCNCKYYWWISHDSHANYHMHNYQHYQDKLLEFLNAVN